MMDQRRAEMLLYKKQVQLLGNEGAKRCSKTHLNRIKYRMKQDHTCLNTCTDGATNMSYCRTTAPPAGIKCHSSNTAAALKQEMM